MQIVIKIAVVSVLALFAFVGAVGISNAHAEITVIKTEV